MSIKSGTMKKLSKEHGLVKKCAGAGEKDEEESGGEETAEKTFVWENSARPGLH